MKSALRVQPPLGKVFLEHLRTIATVNNRIAHGHGYKFKGDEGEFLIQCKSVLDDLELLIKKRQTRLISVQNSNQVGEISTASIDIDRCREAAERGNAISQSILGMCYEQGLGVDQDDNKAFYWYRKASEQGDTSAQNQLGRMYLKGIGVEQDDSMAIYWYSKAAEWGDATAQNELGWMYEKGRGVEQDDNMAVYWYRESANQGEATAQFNLGWKCQQGRSVEQDDSMAVYRYRKAAEQG